MMRTLLGWMGVWVCLPLALALSGCGTPIPGNGGGGGGGGTDDDETLRVNFDAGGGNYAVGEDEDGNQYTFRTTEGGGDPRITEANIRTIDGKTLKASLDAEGRPVNFRMSDKTAADLVYDNDSVRIRYTGPDGALVEEGRDIDYSTAKEWVQARRVDRRDKASTRMQSISFEAGVISNGMETYEEIVVSICDDDFNPGSPLASNPQAAGLRDAALLLGNLASLFAFVEVEREVLVGVTLDFVPDPIAMLAGRTYVLFDAEGLCVELTDTANTLTFDGNGLLLTEMDRHLVFSDFSLGGLDRDVTINYLTGTPVVLNPGGEGGFQAVVTPVFTGTQLDDFGYITIERRFHAEMIFPVDLFGTTVAEADKLFDAAFLNGELSPDGSVLEVDLVLIDLEQENPALHLGRLRYHDQNTTMPPRVFGCEVITGEFVDSGIICPGSAFLGEDFSVEYLFGRGDYSRDLYFDWFVSAGFGLLVGDPFGPDTVVRAVAPGFLEITLVVSDLSAAAEVFEVFTCGVNVGGGGILPPSDLLLECPAGLNVGELGFFEVSGLDVFALDYPEWFVFGTSDFYIDDPYDFDTTIQFYQPGRFEVAFQGYDAFTGAEVWASCEVRVGGIVFDECDVNGWYGDGECDLFCPAPDPDCGDDLFDFCELNGYYGDGECDEFCLFVDPDCEGDFVDFCAISGWYGDGECDLFCPLPDPDCDAYDICAENGWYGDGMCDEICPLPDPDCEVTDDVCEVNGYYGDYECDDFCLLPDPDCEDECVLNGWYGDGECDLFCPLLDPDCL